MSWVKLDDRIFDNPKIAALSDTAKVAYLESVCYCARELTDGFIPHKKALGLAGKPRVVQEITPQLWEVAPGGFMVHDYLKYNPTRAQVLAEREGAKRRKFGRSSGEPLANFEQGSGEKLGEVHPPPVDPVNPDIPPSSLVSHNPHPHPVRRAVVVGFEQAFGRLLSPTEIELIRALEEEHPSERLEYALREAAALNKRSVRYVQRTCERMATDGDSGRTGSGQSAKAAHTNGVADRVPDVDERISALAERRRNRTA